MNRGKQPMSNRAQKKVNKEVRSAQTASFATVETAPLPSEPIAQELLNKFPKKSAKKIKAQVDATVRGMANKKKKQHAKHSKRSTPGDVAHDADFSPPKVVQIEGKRWIKTIEKQIRTKTSMSRRQEGKKKAKKSSWKRFFFGL